MSVTGRVAHSTLALDYVCNRIKTMNIYIAIGLVATFLTQSYQTWVAFRAHKAIRNFEANFVPISFDVIMQNDENDRDTQPDEELAN